METRTVRVLLVTLGVGWSAGCMPPEQSAAAPRHTEARDDGQIERDQRELERRRAQLQQQVLGELRKLRESRQASTNGAEPSDDADAAEDEDDLVVFGGATHEVFLGCLCDGKRPDSVFNLSGEHGSDVSPASIRNKFAPYGSDHDDTSACDAKATHPPVVLTSKGKSLGLLTMNPDLKRRITTPSVESWLTRMCQY